MYRSDGRIMYRMGQLIEEILMELAQFKPILSYDYEETVEFLNRKSLEIVNAYTDFIRLCRIKLGVIT